MCNPKKQKRWQSESTSIYLMDLHPCLGNQTVIVPWCVCVCVCVCAMVCVTVPQCVCDIVLTAVCDTLIVLQVCDLKFITILWWSYNCSIFITITMVKVRLFCWWCCVYCIVLLTLCIIILWARHYHNKIAPCGMLKVFLNWIEDTCSFVIAKLHTSIHTTTSSLVESWIHAFVSWTILAFPIHFSYPTALAMIASGKVNVKPLVTHRYTLEQTIEAFEAAKRGEGVKIMISCERK